MNIQAINSNYYQPKFKAIYVSEDAVLSERQQKIVDETIRTLRTPSETLNNKTPEKYWGNRGINFNLEKSGNDTVLLEGYENARTIITGVEEVTVYSNAFKIGIYDENNTFKPEDIEAGLKSRNKQYWLRNFLNFAGIVSFGTIAMVLGNMLTKSPSKVQETAKPLIENVDSIANKVKEAIPDTTKVLRSIKK